MKIVGVVQARMGSQRLPGKVLASLAGEPVVGHIIRRLNRVPAVASIVVATTTQDSDGELARYAEAAGADVVRADNPDDIVGRLAGVVAATGADGLLKVNGDCPACDPAIMTGMAEKFRTGDYDYISNKIDWDWPPGLTAEIIRSSTVLWCHSNLVDGTCRELVANYIKEQQQLFRVGSYRGDGFSCDHDLTLDTVDDQELLERMFSELYPQDTCFGAAAIRSWCRRNPVAPSQQ